MSPLHLQSTVRAYLLARIRAGALEPGDRISLPTVARKLELSVTPVRETLTRLGYSGVVAYRERRGFFIAELSAAEAHRLYHTVVALETEALRAAIPNSIDLATLREANAAFAKTPHAAERYDADARFHEALCAFFADSPVEQLLEDLRVRIYLYERAYLEVPDNVAKSVALHDEIIAALAAGDADAACAALRQNWLNISAVLGAAGLADARDIATSQNS